jgi:SAM-dependent methyltransferase
MSDNDICLNIGCWTSVGDGWLNVDASIYVKLSKIPLVGSLILAGMKAPQFPASIQCGDLVKGLQIPVNSCQLIFASHVLEHLTLSDFNIALKNLYLYLKPGGIIRIIVPDLESYVKDYLEQRADPQKAAQAAYQLMNNSYLGNQASRRSFYHRFREIFANSRHQWMWDEPSLTEALKQQGLKDIRRCYYGDWSDPRFQLVEEKNRHWKAICLEATKEK